MTIRNPAVAGSFYPGTEKALRSAIERLCVPSGAPLAAYGAIAPHAGYIYSGSLAGAVFARVFITNIVVLLCPNHTGMGAPVSVWHKGVWRTPLGDVPIDEELATLILDSIPAFDADTRAHLREHSIEVMLPFLQFLNPAVKIVPICVAVYDLDELAECGDLLAKAVSPSGSLIVGSTDMTHFESAAKASIKDAPALDAIEKLDFASLFKYIKANNVSMCGVAPITMMVSAMRTMGAKSAFKVGYTHSGMVTGDSREVVAYSGFIIPK